jgi:aminoglycoside phosphotransferase (APT) family kinase protein
MQFIDHPAGMREGESLDPVAVKAFLEKNIGGISGPVEIKQFPSGFSNLTYLGGG